MVSLIPKKKRKKGLSLNVRQLWEAKQIVAGLAVFILVLVSYGGLRVYGGVVASALTGLEADAKRLGSGLDQEAENSARLFAARLAQVTGLLDTHIQALNIFELLEQATHPRVQFTKFSLNEGRVTITGLTDSYVSFGQQIIILEAHEEIHDLDVSDISLNKKGQVVFSIIFTVDKSVYQQYAQ